MRFGDAIEKMRALAAARVAPSTSRSHRKDGSEDRKVPRAAVGRCPRADDSRPALCLVGREGRHEDPPASDGAPAGAPRSGSAHLAHGGRSSGNNQLVFPGREGEPWAQAYQSWRRRAFRRATEAAGVAHACPYDLRRSFASLLLYEGWSVIYVARQLGHDARLTLTRYGHVIDELEDRPRIEAEGRSPTRGSPCPRVHLRSCGTSAPERAKPTPAAKLRTLLPPGSGLYLQRVDARTGQPRRAPGAASPVES